MKKILLALTLLATSLALATEDATTKPAPPASPAAPRHDEPVATAKDGATQFAQLQRAAEMLALQRNELSVKLLDANAQTYLLAVENAELKKQIADLTAKLTATEKAAAPVAANEKPATPSPAKKS